MKLWRAANVAAAIGCHKLDENSIARLTRLIMHVDSPNREWHVVDALDQLKTLKQHLARLGSAPQVDTTPESPELLRRANPLVFANVYNTEGPTACPVSNDTLSYIYSQASCRSTKKEVGCNRPSPKVANNVGLDFAALGEIAIRQGLLALPPPNEMPNGFTLCRPGGSVSGNNAPNKFRRAVTVGDWEVALSNQLCLGDGPPPCGAADRPSPRDEADSPGDAGKAAPPADATQLGATADPAPPADATQAVKQSHPGGKKNLAALSDAISSRLWGSEAEPESKKAAPNKKGNHGSGEGKDKGCKKVGKDCQKESKATKADKGGKHEKKAKHGKQESHPVMKRPAAAMEAQGVTLKQLVFPGTKSHCPIYVLGSTIYYDRGRKLWRLKPKKGSRVTHKFRFTDKPREAWARLVKMVKDIN